MWRLFVRLDVAAVGQSLAKGADGVLAAVVGMTRSNSASTVTMGRLVPLMTDDCRSSRTSFTLARQDDQATRQTAERGFFGKRHRNAPKFSIRCPACCDRSRAMPCFAICRHDGGDFPQLSCGFAPGAPQSRGRACCCGSCDGALCVLQRLLQPVRRGRIKSVSASHSSASAACSARFSNPGVGKSIQIASMDLVVVDFRVQRRSGRYTCGCSWSSPI